MASHTLNGRQGGFTYLSVVILVAILGLVGATSLRLGSTLQRVAAEQQLLDIGAEYSDALASYAAATPAGQPTYPPSFKELLKDSRFPTVRRHLRRVYVDPMTGKAEWGLVTAGGDKAGGKPGALAGVPGAAQGGMQSGMQGSMQGGAQSGDKGGILAIYSLSTAQPVKVGNFPPRFVAFDGKMKISDWKFSAEYAQGKGGAGAGPGMGSKDGVPAPGSPPAPGQSTMQPGQPPAKGEPQQEPPVQPPSEPPPEPEEQAPPPEPKENQMN